MSTTQQARGRGRPAVVYLDAEAVAARLAVPGLSGEVVSALLARVPLFLPGAVQNDRGEWRVRGDLLDRMLAGDESRVVGLFKQLGGLSLRSIGELLGCDSQALARHKRWRTVIRDVPGVGLRVSVADYLKSAVTQLGVTICVPDMGLEEAKSWAMRAGAVASGYVPPANVAACLVESWFDASQPRLCSHLERSDRGGGGGPITRRDRLDQCHSAKRNLFAMARSPLPRHCAERSKFRFAKKEGTHPHATAWHPGHREL